MNVGKQLKLILVAGLALSVLSTASALAIAREDGTPVEAEEGSNIQLMQTQRLTTEVKNTLQERLTERKASLSTTLTTTQSNRLKARCEAAQTKLKAISARSETAITARAEAYQVVMQNLQNLTVKLEGNVQPATLSGLEALVEDLAIKITAFETTSNDYKQTIADLVEVDCVADPAGFKASLETAKTEQASTKESAAAVRTLLQGTIKTQLQTIRSELSGELN